MCFIVLPVNGVCGRFFLFRFIISVCGVHVPRQRRPLHGVENSISNNNYLIGKKINTETKALNDPFNANQKLNQISGENYWAG